MGHYGAQWTQTHRWYIMVHSEHTHTDGTLWCTV